MTKSMKNALLHQMENSNLTEDQIIKKTAKKFGIKSSKVAKKISKLD